MQIAGKHVGRHHMFTHKSTAISRRCNMSMPESERPMTKLLFQLTLDFDGTLTARDTMESLANAGYIKHAKLGTAYLPPWRDLATAYMKDFHAHKSQYRPTTADRTRLEDEVGWLRSLQTIEQSSLKRVKECGLFAGVTAPDVREAAMQAIAEGRVRMREGWLEFLQKVHKVGISGSTEHVPNIRIISVNWSRAWILACMNSAAKRSLGLKADAMETLNSIAIYAGECFDIQEFEPFARGSAISLFTSGDKERLFATTTNSLPQNDNLPLKVYIGDSTTDLECLLAADIGICMVDDPANYSPTSLLETLDRIGVSIEHLVNLERTHIDRLRKIKHLEPPPSIADEILPSNDPKRKTLYHVKDFREISRWLETSIGE